MVTRLRQSRTERDKGFTLIELLVVIIIIGILAAIAIPIFLNQRKKANNAAIKSDLRNAAEAAEVYAVDHPNDASSYWGPDIKAAGFRKTPGNDLRINGSPRTGYCIVGANDNSDAQGNIAVDGNGFSTGNQKWFVYDSTRGGLQPGGPVTWPSLPTTGPCAPFAGGVSLSLN